MTDKAFYEEHKPPNFGVSAAGQTCYTCEHFEHRRGYEYSAPDKVQFEHTNCLKYGFDFVMSKMFFDFFTHGCDGWEVEK